MIVPLAAAFAVLAAAPSPAPTAPPCGYVNFIPVAPARYVAGTAYERMRMRVGFPDGHTESMVLPYPWIYPDGERNDPWSITNLRDHPNATVAFQFPPANYDRNAAFPLLAYVLAHTSANGQTTLSDCKPARSKAVLPPSYAHVHIRETALVDAGAQLDVIPFDAWEAAANGATRVKQCVMFTNRSDRTVQSVRFTFRYVTATGAPISSGTLDVTGPYATGAGTPDFRRPGVVPDLRPCTMMVEQVGLPPPERRIAEAITSVESVEYEDGTAWHLSRP
ncbi:MAG TPA: hypothetical protein VHT53_08655 [Candidatus Elarobacter sp.]|jgi:hypothetical protein|nr:hypothetical protein [Candidatus Elarobacter sp.]